MSEPELDPVGQLRRVGIGLVIGGLAFGGLSFGIDTVERAAAANARHALCIMHVTY